MTTPSLRSRLFGNPVVAVIIGGWFVKTAGSWYLHHAPFGAVLFTFCLSLLSLSSWRKLRIHQAWLRQWNDAGGVPAEPASDRRHGLFRTKQSKGAVMLPLLLVFVLPLAAQNIPHDAPVMPLLTLTWFACIGWFVVMLLRRFRKPGMAAVSVTAEAPAIVSWVAGPATSAPSRADAIRNLPDYALSAMGLERVGH